MRTTKTSVAGIGIMTLLLAGCGTAAQKPLVKDPRAALIDALVTERLKIDLVREEGGSNPCEPREPYVRMEIARHAAEPFFADPDSPDGGRVEVRGAWQETDLGQGIALIERTGQVEIMDVCLE